MPKDIYEVDHDIYYAWLKDKTQTIENMQTVDEIEARIVEIAKIQFFATKEWAILHSRFNALTGRHRIPAWIQADRAKMITEPNIKINLEGEPRKKEKKPKEDNVKKFLGIDLKEEIRKMKAQSKGNQNHQEVKEKKPVSTASLMDELMATKPKATSEEIAAKSLGLKEKIRLAKEAAAKRVADNPVTDPEETKESETKEEKTEE